MEGCRSRKKESEEGEWEKSMMTLLVLSILICSLLSIHYESNRTHTLFLAFTLSILNPLSFHRPHAPLPARLLPLPLFFHFFLLSPDLLSEGRKEGRKEEGDGWRAGDMDR